MEKITFKLLSDNIIHVSLPTRNELASALIRFQEYYESPFEDIRGKIFTLGYLRSKGGRNLPGISTYEGGETYPSEWTGYNFPGYVLEPFIKGLFDPLASYEKDIVNALKYRQDKFYVIGTYGDDTLSESLDHEICHALYYTNENYKKDVDVLLKSHNLKNLKKMLLSWGYCKEVLDDECHAYLSADYDWLFKDKKEDIDKFGISIHKNLHLKLRFLKSKYFKG